MTATSASSPRGGGGYWFTVTESINVKLASKTSSASLVYTITFNQPVRNSYVLTAYDGTAYTADNSGSIGFPCLRLTGAHPLAPSLANSSIRSKPAASGWI
ncbi:hypothetical protein ACFSQ7_31480 [Paenibacillus rhizoplanae]